MTTPRIEGVTEADPPADAELLHSNTYIMSSDFPSLTHALQMCEAEAVDSARRHLNTLNLLHGPQEGLHLRVTT